MADACRDGRVEASGLFVRRHRGLEQATISEGMQQTGEQIRVRRSAAGAIDQTQHGLLSPPHVHFEIRVQVVREWQLRVDFERPLERRLRPFEILGGGVMGTVVSQNPVQSSQAGA